MTTTACSESTFLEVLVVQLVVPGLRCYMFWGPRSRSEMHKAGVVTGWKTSRSRTEALTGTLWHLRLFKIPNRDTS